MHIRPATSNDWQSIWAIFQPIVRQGTTYAYAPDITAEAACEIWTKPPAIAYVALDNHQIVGTYSLKPNQPGLGDHVANAGFMVAADQSGKGIGRKMAEHAIATARDAGFLAMQFNFVVSANERAIALWESLGFNRIGTVPQAFRHATLGLIDIHIFHRLL
jgi:L-amino acid N-acyltransferase YncA